MSKWLRSSWWGLVTLVALAAAVAFPHFATAQDAAGFDGFIQSGTCEAPTDDVKIDLESEEDYDVQPYVAKIEGGDDTITLAYYGAPLAPGFGYATIFTDQNFSLVMTQGGSDEAVACGDLLEPDDEDFADAGIALVRLQPVGGSGVSGTAVLERTNLQREEDAISTRVRILLLTEAEVAPPAASPEATPVS